MAMPWASSGFWVDEIIMAFLATPFLWAGLTSIHPMWHLIFLYGWVILPTLVIYMFWASIHTAWLRWAGAIDAEDRRLYNAYEVLLADDHLQRWLGEITVDYDAGRHCYRVGGALPRSYLLTTLRTRLGAIDGATVDVSGVRIDPDLMPNARLELALSRRRRFAGPRSNAR